MSRMSSGAGCVALACIVGCGPSVGEPSASASDTTTSGDTSSGGSGSITATVTSSPDSDESSVGTQATADVSSGETTTSLDLGGSSSESGGVHQCAECGPDEVCIELTGDGCNPWHPLPCVPIPVECEVVTCDDPDCAAALCGADECRGYAARGCHGEAASFVCEQSGTGSIECDVWGQDCPRGEKCVSFSEDGGDAFDSVHCTPFVEMPAAVGQPCLVEGHPTSGIDDCGAEAQCLDVDPVTLVGTCRALCSGSEANPSCDDPEMTCTMLGSYYAWCLP